MGLFAAITRLGVAKKVFNTARKPENQQKIKDAVARLRARRQSR